MLNRFIENIFFYLLAYDAEPLNVTGKLGQLFDCLPYIIVLLENR